MQKPTSCFTALLLLASLFFALPFWARQTCAQVENSLEHPGQKVIGNWIKQLGDESFAVREEAAEKLSAAGFSAIPLLRAAAQAKELEVRLRVQGLLKELELRVIDEKIAALLNDTDGTVEHDLPMWKTWRKILPADADSRNFFASILKSNYGFLAHLDIDTEKAEQEYQRRIGDLLFEVLSQGRAADLADLGAILLVGSDERIRFELKTAMRLYNILQSSRTVEAVVRSEFAEPAMSLLAHWIARNSAHEHFPTYGARLALHYELDDLALLIARKSLATGNQEVSHGGSMDLSILVVAIHGSRDDIKSLQKWFDDETRCGSWVDKNIETQIRDVALAAVIELSHQDLSEFGFAFAVEKMEGWYGWYPTYSLGFEDNTKREAAFAKWKEWQAASTAK